MLRALGAALVATCLSCTDAAACFGPAFVRSIFYDEVPGGTNAPAIAEVTIIGYSRTAEKEYFVGVGRVDRVFRGEIDSQTIKVLSGLTECLRRYDIGSHGIVIGTLRRDAVH
jgi:hypothetical protein